MKYIYIGISAFLVSIAITILFLFYGQRFLPDGNDKALVYFIILIPLGICCAYMLFRVIRSYAHFKGTYRKQTLEVSGPAVMFLLVVGIGYYFIDHPPLPPSFTLTIIFKDTISLKPLSGNANISYGGSYFPAQKIDEGQIKFSNKVSTGLEITIEPEIPGYVLNGNKVFIVPGNNESLELKLTKKQDEQAKKDSAIEKFRSYVNDYDNRASNFAEFLNSKIEFLFNEKDTAHFKAFVTILNEYNAALDRLFQQKDNMVTTLSIYMPDEKDRVQSFFKDFENNHNNLFEKFNSHEDTLVDLEKMRKLTSAQKNDYLISMHKMGIEALKWISNFERESKEIIQKIASL